MKLLFFSNKYETHVIGVCEHWEHRDNLTDLVIPGFILASAYQRPSEKRGGTAKMVQYQFTGRLFLILNNYNLPTPIQQTTCS